MFFYLSRPNEPNAHFRQLFILCYLFLWSCIAQNRTGACQSLVWSYRTSSHRNTSFCSCGSSFVINAHLDATSPPSFVSVSCKVWFKVRKIQIANQLIWHQTWKYWKNMSNNLFTKAESNDCATKSWSQYLASQCMKIIFFDILVHPFSALSSTRARCQFVYSWRNKWQPQFPNLPLRASNMQCIGWAIEFGQEPCRGLWEETGAH